MQDTSTSITAVLTAAACSIQLDRGAACRVVLAFLHQFARVRVVVIRALVAMPPTLAKGFAAMEAKVEPASPWVVMACAHLQGAAISDLQR